MKPGPNPVEYLCGSVNSCIVMSAGMITKAHQLDVKNFNVKNYAKTEKMGYGKSVVTEMRIEVSFDSEMSKEEKEEFLAHVLHVSTIYQTIKEAIKIYVELDLAWLQPLIFPVNREISHSSQNFLPPLSLGDYGVHPHKISHNRYCSPTESGGVSAFLLLFFQCISARP